MDRKTKVHVEEGKQELRITREFDLPVELLFRAFCEPEIVAQWMGTKVLKLEPQRHGSYEFVTTDPKGNAHGFNGTIHEFVPNQKITRTFEMEGSAFPVQLEYLKFVPIDDGRSRLEMHVVYASVAVRDEILKMPFAFGIDMAHNRLQAVASKLNS